MNEQTYFAGDAIAITFKLRIDGLPFKITPGSTVEGALLDCNGKESPQAKLAILEATAGSDWRNSTVVYSATASESADLPLARYRLQVRVDELDRTFTKPEAFAIDSSQVE